MKYAGKNGVTLRDLQYEAYSKAFEHKHIHSHSAYPYINSNKEVLFQNFDIVDIYFIFMFDDFPKVCTSLHKILKPKTLKQFKCIHIDCTLQHFTTITCRHSFVLDMCLCWKTFSTIEYWRTQSVECLLNSVFSLWLILFESRKCTHWNASALKFVCIEFSKLWHWSLKLCWY